MPFWSSGVNTLDGVACSLVLLVDWAAIVANANSVVIDVSERAGGQRSIDVLGAFFVFTMELDCP